MKNKRKFGDSVFSAAFKHEVYFVYAINARSAKQKAIEFFKPKKHERDFISIVEVEHVEREFIDNTEMDYDAAGATEGA